MWPSSTGRSRRGAAHATPTAAAAAMRDHLVWASQADLHGSASQAELRAPRRPRRVGEWGWSSASTPAGRSPTWWSFDSATGRVDSLKTSSTPQTPGQAIVNALDEGGVGGRRASRRFTHGTTVGHERADRADRLQGGVRHDEGLRGHALHPAHQPQGALRPALDASRSHSSRAAASASACDERLDSDGAEVRPVDEAEVRELCAPRSATTGAEAVARLPALLLRQHRARGARQGDPRRGAAGLARLGLARGRPDLARVRAVLDHDRRRLPEAAVRALRRAASTPRSATRA